MTDNFGYARRVLVALVLVSGAFVAGAFIANVAQAQGHRSSAPTGLSDSDKAKLRDQQAFEKDTDAAYKKSLERIPAKQQKLDPWGSVREAPAK